MKINVKITIILGTITSFFPVYPMKISREASLEVPHYSLSKKDLKDVNPILNINDLTFHTNSSDPIFEDNPLFKDGGLALFLTTMKVLEEPDKTKNAKTLKTIYNAVNQKIPVISQYTIDTKSSFFVHRVIISPHSHNCTTPVLMLIKNLIDEFCTNTHHNFCMNKAIFSAIFQGERDRKERLKKQLDSDLTTDIRNELAIEVPESITSVIFSFLPESDVDEERTRYFEEAEKKFHEEQQSRSTLFKKSDYDELIFFNIAVDYE